MPSEPPDADPHVRWCGGRRGEPGAYPIRGCSRTAQAPSAGVRRTGPPRSARQVSPCSSTRSRRTGRPHRPSTQPVVREVSVAIGSTGRIRVNVATPMRCGGCDEEQATVAEGRSAGREAAAVRAADRAGDQQHAGVPDRRGRPQDGEPMAVRPIDPEFRRGARALSAGEDRGTQAGIRGISPRRSGS